MIVVATIVFILTSIAVGSSTALGEYVLGSEYSGLLGTLYWLYVLLPAIYGISVYNALKKEIDSATTAILAPIGLGVLGYLLAFGLFWGLMYARQKLGLPL